MKKTWKHRLAAFGAAGALALAMAPMAAFGLAQDKTLEVSGMDNGDTVEFYQIIQQNKDTKAWEFVSALDAEPNKVLDGHSSITLESLRANRTDNAGDYKVITADMANEIAAAVASNTNIVPAYTVTAKNNKAIAGSETSPVKPGLYMAIVTNPASTDVVYKPIFVSSDYDQTQKTNELDLAQNNGYKNEEENKSIFKKSKLTLVKTSGAEGDKQQDVAVGDTVDFVITTNLPSYTQNFVSPKFVITDELTDGLELLPDSIVVEVEGYTEGADKAVKGTDYVVDPNIETKKSFTVEFKNSKTKTGDVDNKDGFLYTVKGNPKVTVKYKAKVTSAAATQQVNQMDNTVQLDFSHNPKNGNEVGTLKDRTRHYTFSLDAKILGGNLIEGEDQTSELRKIAVDANGEVVEYSETKTINSTKSEKKFDWLPGATFELKQIQVFKNDGGMEPSNKTIKFTDGVQDADGENAVSSSDGRIKMSGLDAGVYELKEVTAPLGYSFDPNRVYKITITPEYDDDNETDTTFVNTPNKILKAYTVKIEYKDSNGVDQKAETKYTADTTGANQENNNGKPVTFIAEGQNVKGAVSVKTGDKAESALIVNKQLGILPATGGSGILFYVGIGAAIMALAIVLSRRGRKSAPTHGVTA